MKKFLALLLALVIVMSFAACEKDESAGEPSGTEAPKTIEDITGETFDAGNVTALVPTGWTAFPATDVFADDPNTLDPDKIQICKGGTTELDLFSHAYIQIIYYSPDMTMIPPAKEFYDSATDLEPIVAGNMTWQGFVGDSMGVSIAALWTTTADGHQFQVNCWLDNEKSTINLTDLDMLAILASIAPSK